MVPHPSEVRQKILKLGQLDLQSALPAARALRKDIEDQLGSIENLSREQILQIAALRGRKFIVKNDRGHLLILTRVFDRFRFAAADIVRSSRFLQLLRDSINYLRPGGIRQLSQFVERILQIPLRDAFLFEANQKRTLLRFLRMRFYHLAPKAFVPPNVFGAKSLLRCT